MDERKGGRRGAERVAEAERENVRNVPEGRDIQDLVGGQRGPGAAEEAMERGERRERKREG